MHDSRGARRRRTSSSLSRSSTARSCGRNSKPRDRKSRSRSRRSRSWRRRSRTRGRKSTSKGRWSRSWDRRRRLRDRTSRSRGRRPRSFGRRSSSRCRGGSDRFRRRRSPSTERNGKGRRGSSSSSSSRRSSGRQTGRTRAKFNHTRVVFDKPPVDLNGTPQTSDTQRRFSAPTKFGMTGPEAATVGASGINFAEVRQLKQQIEDEVASLQRYVVKAREARDQMAETALEREKRESEYFKASVGLAIGPGERFVMQEEIGRGMFSSVYRCKDVEISGMEYAAKFTRSNPMLRKATEREIRLMGHVCTESAKDDPEGFRHLLGLAFFEGFDHEGHLVAIFELMKCDLRVALQRYGQGKGLPLLPTVRNFSRHLVLALRALRRAKLIHCDVKPENLLLSMDKEMIKLSDFGSMMRVEERVRTNYLQPRFYRAPEVILGHTYGTPIDMWGAGATVFELATDRGLFQGNSNNAMLHEMLKVLGAFPVGVACSGSFSDTHFNSGGDFLNATGEYTVNSSNPAVIPMASFSPPPRPLLQQLESVLTVPPAGIPVERHKGSVANFADFLSACLAIVPAERATPESALALRFFEKGA
eukprot:TRINITY_DN27700_c0_g1_i1.p1 TRINITY_DN27700_c0_g1~~TRINITY_DN27700_c0_g1_i1.p1  ORF type:complete len:611 (+),score=51.60 TRINITY_DN27700_c0_g1_i1:69-1835(+)